MDDRRLSRCVRRGRGSPRHARRKTVHDPSRDIPYGTPYATPHDSPHDSAHDSAHDTAPDAPCDASCGSSRDSSCDAPSDPLCDPARDPAGLIARLADIGSRLGGQPRQEFRNRLRESLLSAHESSRRATAGRREEPDAAPADPPPPIRRPLLVRLRPVALALALTAVLLLVSWGTHRAVPGDLLYPLKRGAESALVGLSIDETARAERELVTARNRAAEAAALAEDPSARKLLEATIDDMASSTRSALSTLTRVKRRDTGSSRKIRRFTKEQRNMVEPLLPSLKGSSKAKANAYLHLIEGFEGS